MKTRALSAAVISLLMAACQSQTSKTQDFIPGTYVNFAKGDYAIANDTLLITQLSDNNYQLIRKTTYQAIRNGKLLPKHHKTDKLVAVYDPQKLELDETTTGRVFRFDPDKHILLIKQASYQKIK